MMTKHAVPHLAEGSSIVFIGSTTGSVGFPGCSAYTATNRRGGAVTRALAVELAPKGIPREHRRALLTNHADAPAPPRRERRRTRMDRREYPSGRIDGPEDLAPTIGFLPRCPPTSTGRHSPSTAAGLPGSIRAGTRRAAAPAMDRSAAASHPEAPWSTWRWPSSWSASASSQPERRGDELARRHRWRHGPLGWGAHRNGSARPLRGGLALYTGPADWRQEGAGYALFDIEELSGGARARGVLVRQAPGPDAAGGWLDRTHQCRAWGFAWAWVRFGRHFGQRADQTLEADGPTKAWPPI